MGIQKFKFKESEIQAIQKDGEPWFIAKEIADILEIKNARQLLPSFPSSEKDVYSVYTLGGTQNVTIISESGLYRMIFQSRKIEAENFKTWIVTEVLPSIRKTGSYSKPKSLEEISLLAITGLTAKIEEQKQALIEAQPKIEFFDVVADSQGERTIMEAAKLLKIPKPKSLYKTLRLRGVLSNDNIPYQRYILDGFFRVNLTEKNGRTFSTAYVTNKGLNWLQKKFAGAK